MLRPGWVRHARGVADPGGHRGVPTSTGGAASVRRVRWARVARVGPIVLMLVLVAQSAAAPARPAAPAAPVTSHAAAVAGPFRPPLSGDVVVTRPFDPPPRRWLPGHRGVDLAGSPEAVVRAAGPGVVRFAGAVAGRGVVSVDHPGGLRTTYEPVTPVVVAGARVAAGDPLGTLAAGHAGCPVAACLHWGLRQGSLYLDPLSLLGLGGYRLLPT